MDQYRIAKQMSIGTGIQIAILNVLENISNINKSVLPRLQIDELTKYRNQFDIDKRLLARSYLYEFIKSNYGITKFDLQLNRFEKPSLMYAPNIKFSFSYAKEYVLVGISEGRKLGLDIEYVNTQLDVEEIAREIMNTNELLKFQSYDLQLRRNYFFKVFSAKESIVKAYGVGLFVDVKTLDSEQSYSMFNSEEFMYDSSEIWRGEYVISTCFQVLKDR